MGNRDLDGILSTPGKPGSVEFLRIRAPEYDPKKQKKQPVMHCGFPANPKEQHPMNPDEGREFAYAYEDEYKAWRNYEKSKEEPQHEIVIDMYRDDKT